MSLNELVTSQPEETGPTPVETENEMVNDNEEQASETSVNSDGNNEDQNSIDPEQQEEDALKDKTQKRINELIGSRKELEEKVIRLEAEREAAEKYSQSNQEKTLKDYSIDVLTKFVADNQNDDEMLTQVSEAREIIIEKRIDAKVNAMAEKQTATTDKEKGEQLTNVMIDTISGDKLRDTNGEYFAAANQYLHDLTKPAYSNLNKDQLIATLLAERDFQMKQPKGPTMNDRIETNKRNNTIKANTRQSSGGESNIQSFLQENPVLEKSTLGNRGTINQAVRKLLEGAEGG